MRQGLHILAGRAPRRHHHTTSSAENHQDRHLPAAPTACLRFQEKMNSCLLLAPPIAPTGQPGSELGVGELFRCLISSHQLCDVG